MNNEASRLKEIIDVIKKHHLIKEFNPQNIRLALEELGPTFIKIGQIMSSRSDVIPQEYCDELKKLRNFVKPMEIETVTKILNNEYKRDIHSVFKSIDEKTLGSASIAQTHKATLLDGTIVVIKVQRENIYEMMTMDAKLLKKAIALLQLDKLFGNIINLDDFIDEMYNTAKEEMDFNIEAQHIQEFANNNTGIKYLKTLKVYPQYSTSKVLVMEYIGGCKIDDTALLTKEGYDMKEISLKLAQNYIKQAIDDGFFHADPHADNIKILNGKIVFLDFGMMGRISSRNRDLLNKCIVAIIKNNVKDIDHILTIMDISNNSIDHMKLSQDIQKILDKDKTVGISNINIKDFVADMYELMNANSISLPKDVMMLLRGIVVIAGLLEEINPEISLSDVISDRFTINNIINKETIQKMALDTLESGSNLVNVPSELLTILKGVNTGELRFNIEMNDSKTQKYRFDEMFHQLIVTILDVALIIGMSIASTRNTLPKIFYFYLVICIIFTVWIFYKMSVNKIKRQK